MGFYSPSVLIRDAQRHGLKVRPIDILRSYWDCTLEHEEEDVVLRIGFRYVREIREQSAQAMVAARGACAFKDVSDLARRVPELQKNELRNLAACGALNSIDRTKQLHRRDALWQVAKFGRPVGPLLEDIPDNDPTSVLPRMTDIERLITDHHISGFTIGPHPLAYRRKELDRMKLSTLSQVKRSMPGAPVRTAGEVTVKQRPGTAGGIVFLTLHDETGFCDVVLKPHVYDAYRMIVKNSKFLRVHGKLQKIENAKEKGAFVISINASEVFPLAFSNIETRSRDFH